MLLVIYTFGFVLYVRYVLGLKVPERMLTIFWVVVGCIITLVVFQHILLGFVSYPGVMALILKVLLGLFTLLYYMDKKIDILEAYIKVMAFLVVASLPFWLINHFGCYGKSITFNDLKTFFFYTSYPVGEGLSSYMAVRNAGMFWEAGAFSGYLILALAFVALKNGRFQIGNFKREVFWITLGIITAMSTTGFLALLFILNIYVFQNYGIAKIIIVPLTFLVIYLGYSKLDFMQEKIIQQYQESRELSKSDISNTRFGAMTMDLQYIKSQPFTGNGLDAKTRYRFHPWINTDIGHGNGMSNFLVYWGIPFFLFWMFCVYKASRTISQSNVVSWCVLIIVLILLQGEQFLNYPMFLMLFILPYIYKVDFKFV
ncbi:MAG: hypothetical protein Q8908_02635 [Bacteroidota bacterium]|nr:hypothetical protein [Bacteroidota bacterium]